MHGYITLFMCAFLGSQGLEIGSGFLDSPKANPRQSTAIPDPLQDYLTEPNTAQLLPPKSNYNTVTKTPLNNCLPRYNYNATEAARYAPWPVQIRPVFQQAPHSPAIQNREWPPEYNITEVPFRMGPDPLPPSVSEGGTWYPAVYPPAVCSGAGFIQKSFGSIIARELHVKDAPRCAQHCYDRADCDSFGLEPDGSCSLYNDVLRNLGWSPHVGSTFVFFDKICFRTMCGPFHISADEFYPEDARPEISDTPPDIVYSRGWLSVKFVNDPLSDAYIGLGDIKEAARFKFDEEGRMNAIFAGLTLTAAQPRQADGFVSLEQEPQRYVECVYDQKENLLCSKDNYTQWAICSGTGGLSLVSAEQAIHCKGNIRLGLTNLYGSA